MLLEWSDVGTARAFVKSKDLREAMKRAGVVDKPDIYFLDGVEGSRTGDIACGCLEARGC